LPQSCIVTIADTPETRHQLLPFAPSGVGIFSRNVNANNGNNSALRWSNKTPIGKFWSGARFRPEILDARGKVRGKAEEVGLNGHHAALRWVLHHSALKRELGDAMILGSSTFEQHEGNLAACDAGPLLSKLVLTIDGIRDDVKHIAPWAWIGDLSEGIRKDFESRVSY
jgi:aflatoxin B1 aldehyde reductase